MFGLCPGCGRTGGGGLRLTPGVLGWRGGAGAFGGGASGGKRKGGWRTLGCAAGRGGRGGALGMPASQSGAQLLQPQPSPPGRGTVKVHRHSV